MDVCMTIDFSHLLRGTITNSSACMTMNYAHLQARQQKERCLHPIGRLWQRCWLVSPLQRILLWRFGSWLGAAKHTEGSQLLKVTDLSSCMRTCKGIC